MEVYCYSWVEYIGIFWRLKTGRSPSHVLFRFIRATRSREREKVQSCREAKLKAKCNKTKEKIITKGHYLLARCRVWRWRSCLPTGSPCSWSWRWCASDWAPWACVCRRARDRPWDCRRRWPFCRRRRPRSRWLPNRVGQQAARWLAKCRPAVRPPPASQTPAQMSEPQAPYGRALAPIYTIFFSSYAIRSYFLHTHTFFFFFYSSTFSFLAWIFNFPF